MKHCLTLTHACTWMHDQTNTRPAVGWDKHTSSRLRFCRSLHKHPAALPDTSGFRGAPPGLALNFLFGSLKEAVDCDVITDLGTVGSVTMVPSGVTPSLSVPSLSFGGAFACLAVSSLVFISAPLSETNATLTIELVMFLTLLLLLSWAVCLSYNLEIKNQILGRL